MSDSIEVEHTIVANKAQPIMKDQVLFTLISMAVEKVLEISQLVQAYGTKRYARTKRS